MFLIVPIIQTSFGAPKAALGRPSLFNIRCASTLAICQISVCIFYMLLPHEARVCLNTPSISFVFFSAVIYYNSRYGLATSSEHNLRRQLAIYAFPQDVSNGIWLHNICSIIIHHHFHTNAESSHALAFHKSRIYSRSSNPQIPPKATSSKILCCRTPSPCFIIIFLEVLSTYRTINYTLTILQACPLCHMHSLNQIAAKVWSLHKCMLYKEYPTFQDRSLLKKIAISCLVDLVLFFILVSNLFSICIMQLMIKLNVSTSSFVIFSCISIFSNSFMYYIMWLQSFAIESLKIPLYFLNDIHVLLIKENKAALTNGMSEILFWNRYMLCESQIYHFV